MRSIDKSICSVSLYCLILTSSPAPSIPKNSQTVGQNLSFHVIKSSSIL